MCKMCRERKLSLFLHFVACLEFMCAWQRFLKEIFLKNDKHYMQCVFKKIVKKLSILFLFTGA